jgi:hypothetical protein
MPEPDHTLDAISTIAWVLQAYAHCEDPLVAGSARALQQAGAQAANGGVPRNDPDEKTEK